MTSAAPLLAALSLLAAAAAQLTPNLLFDMSLNPECGLFSFGDIPYGPDYGSHPFNVFYDGSTTADFTQGQIGQGNPYLWTSTQWFNPRYFPSVGFQFPGRGWSLQGSWKVWNTTGSNKDIDVWVDNAPGDSPVDTGSSLGGAQGLAWSMHSINYTIRSDYSGGGNWTVDGVTISTGMASEASSFGDVPSTTDYFVVNGQPNPKFTYKGYWAVKEGLGGVGGQAGIQYTQLTSNYSTDGNPTICVIQIPANTSFVIVNGTMGPDYAPWLAAWTPQPAIGISVQTVHAYSPWSVPNALMFFQPLDPTVSYTLGVGVPFATYMGLGVTSITYYSGIGSKSGSGTSTSSGPVPSGSTSPVSTGGSKSAIIGGAVGGGVGGLLLLGALLWFCCRRKKTEKARREEDLSHFEIDESAIKATPFMPQPTSPVAGPVLRSELPQPTVQTYNVQSTQGGYQADAFHTGGFTTAGYSNNNGYGYGPGSSTPGAYSSDPSSPGLGSSAGLLPSHRGSTFDETSSVSPSQSASVVGSSSGAKEVAQPAFASFRNAPSQPQTYPTAAQEKRSLSGNLLPPGPPVGPPQELDGGAIDPMSPVPPVYNPAWSDRRESAPRSSSPGEVSPNPTGPSGHRLSNASDQTTGWQTPREY